MVTGYLIGNNTQVVLGAFNQDLSTINVVSPTNDSGTSKEADSVDLYTNNGVDYILMEALMKAVFLNLYMRLTLLIIL